MIRTIIAVSDDILSQNISQTLSHRGIAVRYRCRTGAEVLRAVREMDGGVVICTVKLNDMTAAKLADRLDGQALLLVLAKGSQLPLYEHDDLFTMTVPLRPAEFVGAVQMLLQMDAMRASRAISTRSDEAQRTIANAKALLMSQHHLSEAEAHRLLQKRSMSSGTPMEHVARTLLANRNLL